MKTGKHDEMHTPHYPNRVERRVSNVKNSPHPGSPKETFSRWHERRSTVTSSRQAHIRELAAETAHLKRMLADLYPELVRSQKS